MYSCSSVSHRYSWRFPPKQKKELIPLKVNKKGGGGGSSGDSHVRSGGSGASDVITFD